MKKLMVTALLAALTAATGRTATIHVPADQPTIQAGIDAAVNNDTVIVAPGEYFENISFRNKTLVLASDYLASGDVNDIRTTIINGSQPTYPDTGSVVIMPGGQTGTTLLAGFTITGGTGTIWRDVSDNLLYREGGGILVEGGNPRIERNMIIDNAADFYPGNSAGGGAIRVGFGAASLVGNLIAYNRGRYGAGAVFFFSAAVIKNNIFWKNAGGQDFGGGGMWLANGTANAEVTNNTIVANTSTGAGGGILVRGQTATILNCVVRGNSGTLGAQIRLGTGTAGTDVLYSDVQGGFAGTANWDADPQYATTNLLLLSSSSCIDSGWSSAAYYDKEDPDNLGFALFPSQGARRNDVGAYGGPNARSLPLFTSAEFGLVTDSIGFTPTGSGDTAGAWITFSKIWFGPVKIDSIRFKHTPTNILFAKTTLPHTTDISRGPDSVQIGWSPVALGELTDTALVYHNDSTTISPFQVIVTGQTVGCCVAATGNIDCDPGDNVDIGDLTSLIDNLFVTFTPLCCTQEANCDGDPGGNVDIGDLTSLIDNLFVSFTPLAGCQ